MSWLKNIFSPKGPVPTDVEKPSETRHGLPVHEEVIHGEKLERRDVFIPLNTVQTKIPIAELRSQFHSGKILGDVPVIVTNFYCGQTYYCGEGTVAQAVTAWENAPLDYTDQEDIQRMVNEYEVQGSGILTKGAYFDFKKLYAQCEIYHQYTG